MASRKRALDHLLLTLLLLLAAMAVTACGSSPTALLEAQDGTVIAAVPAGDAGLGVENRDSVARSFLAVERGVAAAIVYSWTDVVAHPLSDNPERVQWAPEGFVSAEVEL